MRRAIVFVAGLMLAVSALGLSKSAGQNFAVRPWYHPYGYGGIPYGSGFGGGTAAGNYMQGMSTVIRSAGEYNVLSSQAGVNNEEARSKYIDNRKKWSENYFQMKEQRQALDAQKREMSKHSTEALNAAAKSSLPRMLGPDVLDPVTGHITWPEVLRGAEFAASRTLLQQLFELRAKTSHGEGTTLKIHAATKEMSTVLRGQVEKVPANEYIAARKFLDALDYAARAGTL